MPNSSPNSSNLPFTDSTAAKIILFVLVIIALAAVLYSSIINTWPSTVWRVEDAENKCESLCELALNSGLDLSSGPCISNNMAPGRISEGWVCDVAHSPRQAVDDDPTNQCSAYRIGTAKHFVEVDTSCNLIRAI